MLSYYVSTFWFPCCDVRYDFRIQTMFGSSLPPVVCMRAQVLLMFLCLFVYSGIQNILCTQCCQFLWIVYFLLSLRYSLTFIYLVYPMLPVSLDCLFLIAPSVFSNVYLSCVPNVASFSGLSIFDCPFGIL